MKNKLYLILYYISFALTLVATMLTYKLTVTIISINKFTILFAILNTVLPIIFTILIKNKKYKFDNIVLPITYLILFVSILTITIIYNKLLLVSYIHISYFYVILSFYYLLLNVYSILSVKN